MYTQCYSDNGDNKNPICPVCLPYFNELAEPLPFAHCSQSRLYCNISGLPMNENNQPMMLPNGYIYGEQVRLYAKCFVILYMLLIMFMGIWHIFLIKITFFGRN